MHVHVHVHVCGWGKEIIRYIVHVQIRLFMREFYLCVLCEAPKTRIFFISINSTRPARPTRMVNEHAY